MKKKLIALMISLAFFAVPVYGADSKQTAAAAKSPEQVASEVKDLLTRDKVHNVFDFFRRLREYGVTWQPQFCAPDDIVGKLSDEQLRMYAGIKLFDAVYASTFMQRQAVADAVQVIEMSQDRLNLRSYADISGKYFTTLKKAAAEPESVNVQNLLDQLATDYVQDIPALMSGPQSADYLINVLYGFTIEYWHTINAFFELDKTIAQKINTGLHNQPDRTDWSRTIVDLFKCFDRTNENMLVGADLIRKVNFIEQAVSIQNDDTTPAVNDEKRAAYQKITTQVETIRTAILTPAPN